MNDNKRGMHLHDAMTIMGWISGPQAHALSYWTMRLAEEIEGIARYVVPYRTLREMAWENIRPFDNRSNAVSTAYPLLVLNFMASNAHRFPSKYGQCLREIERALHDIRSIDSMTGRKPQSLAA